MKTCQLCGGSGDWYYQPMPDFDFAVAPNPGDIPKEMPPLKKGICPECLGQGKWREPGETWVPLEKLHKVFSHELLVKMVYAKENRLMILDEDKGACLFVAPQIRLAEGMTLAFPDLGDNTVVKVVQLASEIGRELEAAGWFVVY